MERNGNRQRARLAAAILALAGTAALAQPPAETGRREYDGKCAVCHGRDGKGGGPYAAELKTAPPDLTTIARRNGGAFPAKRLQESIEGAGKGHGSREMPVWGLDYTIEAMQQLPDMPVNQAQFVKSRIAALVSYLEKLQAR